MLVLITYDVNTETKAGRRRLRNISKACMDYGQRVQYSVFECDVSPAQWTALRARLVSIIDKNKDSLRHHFQSEAQRGHFRSEGVARAEEMAT